MREELPQDPKRLESKVIQISHRQSFLSVSPFADAAIFCAGALEYVLSEVLELSQEVAHENRRQRITPRHVLLAVRCDQELDQLLKDVTIPEGGVVPFTQSFLEAKKKKKKNA